MMNYKLLLRKEHNVKQNLSVAKASLSLLTLLMFLTIGLLLAPSLLNNPTWSLQNIFLLSAAIVAGLALYEGHRPSELLFAIIAKLKLAIPTLILLLAIGVLVASWIMAGTLPYLMHLGFTWLHQDWFYLFAFVLASVFSLCTGSSWSTIATIGVVMLTIGQPAGANLPALVGAIIGGAYFGDKLSPISDTTNIASVASGIRVEEHIKGMLPTTVPAYLIAACIYFLLPYVFPVELSGQNAEVVTQAQTALSEAFTFSPWVLLPVLALLVFSLFKHTALVSVSVSSFLAFVIAGHFQYFDFQQLLHCAWHGFNVSHLTVDLTVNSQLMANALNRGGVTMLWDAVVIVICAFVYIGLISHLKVLPTIINRLSHSQFTPAKLMTYTLISSGIVNSMTSSQYANSFVVAEAYKERFDEIGLNRRYLSRSLEDTGTMLESIVPWTTTAIFIVATLQVPVSEYWYWQLFSWFNLLFAFTLALSMSTNQKEQTYEV